MGLLKRACRRVWKRLGWGKPRAFKRTAKQTADDPGCYDPAISATTPSSLPGATKRRSRATSPVRLFPLGASTTSLRPSETPAGRGGVEGRFATDAAGSSRAVWTLSSESDSGVCLGREDEEEEEGEAVGGEADSECGSCSSCFLDEDWEDDELEDCDCAECTLERCEKVLEDWNISAKDLTLDKVLSSRPSERVYSGYWHGAVTVHQRQRLLERDFTDYLREAHTLSKIRHENVQLFLGVCLDLKSDSVALVMSNIKGESLHSLLHEKRQGLQFAAMTKYLNQIAQGMAYLHDRGIAHPLLTSRSISIHYRACISMLSPATNTVRPSQLVYLPPEVIRTLTPSLSTHHTPSLVTGPNNSSTTEANIFSFGTIVYELVNLTHPFQATPGELVIWEVGNGRSQSLQHMNTGKLRDLIHRCWIPDPGMRPSFKELLLTLEQNMSPRACGLNAYFSFSDPGRLATTGLH